MNLRGFFLKICNLTQPPTIRYKRVMYFLLILKVLDQCRLKSGETFCRKALQIKNS